MTRRAQSTQTARPPTLPAALDHTAAREPTVRHRSRRTVESHVDESRRDGHLLLTLTNNAVRVAVLPHYGAKVIEVTDLSRCQQWLASPVRPLREPQPGDRWEEHDCSGWDECFPNVAAGLHPRLPISLPDHGEVWSRPWRHRVLTGGAVQTSIDGRLLPYRFTRTLKLHDHGLTADYELRNLSRRSFAVCWTMHPLLGIDCDTNLSMPTNAEAAHDPDALPTSCRPRDPQWLPWTEIQPRYFTGTPTGVAAKLYTRPGGPAVATVVRAQAALQVSMQSRHVNALGLWLNDGGWPTHHPQRHLAVEPSLGAADRLDRAVARHTALHLPAAGLRRWRVHIDFTDPPTHADPASGKPHPQARRSRGLARTEEQR